MKTVTINVTKADIGNGKCGEPDHCPISLAASRRLGMHMCVFSGQMQPDDLYRSIKFSDKVTDFIMAFDAKLKVKPIRFPIRVPNSWI